MTLDKMKAYVEANRLAREQQKLHDWTGRWTPNKVATYFRAMCHDTGGRMELMHLKREDEIKFPACYKAWLKELDEQEEDPGVFFMDVFLFHAAIGIQVIGWRGFGIDLMELYNERERFHNLLRSDYPEDFFDRGDPWAVFLFLHLKASGRYEWVLNEQRFRFDSDGFFQEAVERAENLGFVEYLGARVPQSSPFGKRVGE